MWHRISYNVRIFNEYNWIPEINKEDIFSFIKELKGDVLCIQEFYKKKGIPNLNYKFMHIDIFSIETDPFALKTDECAP